ncbi:sulfonate transport system substrate-binding protein [Paenibacillus sp. RU4T]|nr:sulfonate ABC transporter substrate-binding protein [Paenibacillus sp. RUD330]SIR31685.1 sulfonate transport system substrate-binding protein [Paenibacillus sp. RU4X]SIR42985.1 sulfonate transport system substrate-binding protein [Paenibacillus sp. RU4T]
MRAGIGWKRAGGMIGLSAMLLLAAACGNGDGETSQAGGGSGFGQGAKEKIIHIGYQKYGTANILKGRGSLEGELETIGYKVEWTQFPGGPQLLEAMNVGSIDFGHTGEAPPIFAQAAGTPLVYLAHSPASPKSESILVPEHSANKTVADLKGKKVALNKGSNVHYLLVKALEEAGVDYKDITAVFLPPADARAAFESGSVDAWVIWEPFFSAAQLATKARVLTTGEGLVQNHEFMLASRSFEQNNKEAVRIVLDQLKEADKWAEANQSEVARLLSPELGIDIPSLEQAISHRSFGIEDMDEDTYAEQQRIADAFLKLKLIPEAVKVKDAAPGQ